MRPFCSVTIRRASSIWRAIVLRRSSCVIISVSPTRLHLTWPPLRILMTFSASDPATFADDNQPSRNADTGCRDTGAFERNHRLDQLQPSAYSPLGVALMGLRIDEINEDAVIAKRLYLYAQSSVLGHAGARATSVELRFSQGLSRLLSLLPSHLLSRRLLPCMLITAAPSLSFLAAAT